VDASSTSGSDGSAVTATPQTGHYWEHLGGGGGFLNTMRIYPELKLGLVAMGNATSWDHLKLARAATQAAGDGHTGSGRTPD
jgi:hypothetical protein